MRPFVLAMLPIVFLCATASAGPHDRANFSTARQNAIARYKANYQAPHEPARMPEHETQAPEEPDEDASATPETNTPNVPEELITRVANTPPAMPTNPAAPPATAADITALQTKALRGDSDAEYQLGMRYYSGNGVERNEDETFSWINRAAAQGNPKAEFTLGMIYHKGVGTEQNDEQAVQWITRAAEHDNPRAQVALSMMYTMGAGVPVDFDAANRWREKAHEQFLLEERQKKQNEEKELKAAFPDTKGDGSVQKFNFRCAAPSTGNHTETLLVEMDRSQQKITERVLDPRGGTPQVNEFLDHRLSPMHWQTPGPGSGPPSVNNQRYENVAVNPSSSNGYVIDYGYDAFLGDAKDYRAQVTISHGIITYERVGDPMGSKPVRCAPVSATKVEKFKQEEAKLQQFMASDGKGGFTTEEAHQRASWDNIMAGSEGIR